ncbi:MAG: hypothetical protein NTW19_01340 [Planctomycetota bacterium]|nr:hypothetical protein [Planctomycetota bacterium]
MTDDERQLRRRLAGLNNSHTRTMLALEAWKGSDCRTAKAYRAKYADVKQRIARVVAELDCIERQRAAADGASFPILLATTGTQAEFVDYWDRLYSGYDEEVYRENIGQPLTKERILKWFEWKNGRPLSRFKATSILRYSSPDEQIAVDATADDVRDFLNRPGGAIWRIFWLHLQHPSLYPIYDQHVHRAMAFLEGRNDREIPVSNARKIHVYLQEYQPFFRQLACPDHRRVDRALWTFGRFLVSVYGEMVPNVKAEASSPPSRSP